MEKKIFTVISELQKKTSRHIDRIKLQDFTFGNLLKFPVYFAGSRGDGSNDPKSDTDLMCLVPEIIASELEQIDSNEPHEYGLQVLWSDCHPGYCRLLFKKYDVAGPLYKMCAGSNDYVSNEKFKIWASTELTGYFRPYGAQLLNITNTHGPCNAPKLVYGDAKRQIDLDMVFCIQSDKWPSVANEWLERDRKHDWPSKDLINHVTNAKCTFVPIGYSEDMDKKELEWRASFNMAEKVLMWSLNGTQLLCFEALKTLHSTMIEGRFPDVICSYFLKTILFWVLEETSSDFWLPENFENCFKICLNRLILCLTTGQCEHYFIRCNNMFDRRSENDLHHVSKCIQELDVEKILSVFIDHKLNFFQQNVIFQHHIPVASVSLARHAIHAKLTYIETREKIPSLYAFIDSLHGCQIDENTVHQLQKTLRSTIGALQIALQNQDEAFVNAMQLLEESALSDAFAGRLKLATVKYSQGKLSEVLAILHDLKSIDLQNIVHYSFYERHFSREPTDTSHPCQDMPLADVMSTYVALDVIFMADEILRVPDFIKYLLSDGVPVFISPIVYMNCLEFACQMSKCDLQEMASVKAEFKKSRDIFKGGIPRIDSDLLGYYCMVMGDYEDSFVYLRQSLSTSPYPSKSSLYLMATLMNKCFQGRIEKTKNKNKTQKKIKLQS